MPYSSAVQCIAQVGLCVQYELRNRCVVVAWCSPKMNDDVGCTARVSGFHSRCNV